MASTFLTAEWRKLIMAQYSVDPVMLAPLLPAGTELDLFRGICFVSVVGFLFDRVRVRGLAIPFHTRFEEINLRFYVRRVEPDGAAKRGVVFVREFVPRSAIAAVAKAFYEEPYATLPIRHRIAHSVDALNVQYKWKHRRMWNCLSVEADPEPRAISAGSLEDFITEHYWGFTKRRHGGTSQYEVRHPSWTVYPIRRHRVDIDFRTLYGPEFAGLSLLKPHSVLLAEGSPVSVATGSRLASG